MKRLREACTTTAQVAVITFGWSSHLVKKLEEVDFVNEEFLYKKINNKGIYIWIMVG